MTKWRRWVPFALAVAVQLAVLYWPRAVGTPGALPLDKVVHALVFGAVAWTGVRAGLRPGPLVIVLLAHAVLSEAVQDTLLPGRSGDPRDAAADAVGTLLGAWSALRVRDTAAPAAP